MQRKPLVLIICGAVVILAIVLLVIYLARGGSTNIDDLGSKGKEKEKKGTVELVLSAYPEDETEGSVEISINATSSDDNEIVSITTPDGKQTGYTPDKKYTVDENGEYSFTITASDGQTVTKTINIDNISKISADNPYVPEGFRHIQGTEVDTGFVIEDNYNNQYVWVPVESGSPDRNAPSEKYVEDDNTASALNNSIAKYYGFYIAKYEASKDSENGMIVAKSIEDSIPWSSINYEDAYDASRNTAVAYNYIGVKTALINSYAWDTTLEWLNETVTNYSTSRSYGNYSNQILNTGATESDIVNGIADMAGNLREWTTEKYDEGIVDSEDNKNSENDNSDDIEAEYRTIRGGSATMDKIANSRIGQKTDLQDNYWGFRIILYKE